MVEITNEHDILVGKHEGKNRSFGRLDFDGSIRKEWIAKNAVVKMKIFWLFTEAQQVKDSA